MLICREIKDKNTWENFLSKQKEKTFLQSWAWGEFQEKMDNKIWKLGVFDGQDLLLIGLVVGIKAKRGRFLLVQHGPIIKRQEKEALNIFLEKLKEIGRQENCSFIRIAPLFLRTKENLDIFRNLGLKESPMHANAYEATWKLDISLSEEKLFSSMRKTTRYLIRQAIKNGDIQIKKSNNLSDIEKYQELNKEVASRQKFVPFSKEYIKNEFEVFLKDSQVLLFLGEYKGEVAAAALVIFWSGIGFYHQAASKSKFQKFSIPYLLQWEAIKEAKNRGCVVYDFWGYIDPKKHPKHPWAGPTLFKMGFGGQATEYMKTCDYPLSKKYYLINLFEKLRKFKRGL